MLTYPNRFRLRYPSYENGTRAQVCQLDTEPEGLAGRIRTAMRERGVTTNADLARMVGTSKSRVGKWLAGAEAPGYAHLVALVRELRVSAHWLLTGEGDMEPVTPTEAAAKMRLIRAILETQLTGEREGGREWVEEVLGQYDRQQPDAPPRRAGGGGRSP